MKIVVLLSLLCTAAFGLDCYPFAMDKPNATEELCLAQGCAWNDNSCTFKSLTETGKGLCGKVAVASRLECRNPKYGGVVKDEGECAEMGCCFDQVADGERIQCFRTYSEGYNVVSMEKVKGGYEGRLVLPEDRSGPFGNDIRELGVRVWLEMEDRLRLKIYDPNHERYEVKNIVKEDEEMGDVELMYEFGYTTKPFGVSVVRKLTGQVVFNSTPGDTKFGGLVFENQYLEMSTKLSMTKGYSARIFGLGEQVSNLMLVNEGAVGQHYTFFARDAAASTAQHDTNGGNNIYGTHPFYMQLEDDGNANGVFLLNSNALEVVLQHDAITFRTIGGVLDFYVFLGPTPEKVVKQYTALVGTQILPPYWALGFQLCKWGLTLEKTKEITRKMRQANIPYDVQWNDIDYMDQHAIFTLDPKAYPATQMRQYIDELHDNDMHYVNIHDPGVSSDYTGSYDFTAYSRLLELNAFVKTKKGKDPLIGKVWPGWVAYPDFFHPNATEYWTAEVRKFHKVIPFDGMWIDMNEPSNFCDGERPYNCRSGEDAGGSPDDSSNGYVGDFSGEYVKTPDIAYPFDPFRQPYVPGQSQQRKGGKGNLDSGTIAMSAVQHPSLHYNLHSLYGHSELVETMKAITAVRGKRSLVVSRSTFSGSGKHGMHWLGDNEASWQNLANSIVGILSMNMFGVTFVGADICGFGGRTTSELCIRWQQLGAFYPFSRNHNSIESMPQAPIDFDTDTTNIIKASIETRYRLLPYLYTLYFFSNTQGSTVVRPLFFEFPNDVNAARIDTQFLLGRGLLITPVLQERHREVAGYFPSDRWYDYFTGEELLSEKSFPQKVSLPAPLDFINVHVRGGTILPTQDHGLTAPISRTMNMQLIVALSTKSTHYTASGHLYLDDGEGLDTIEKKAYTLVHFAAAYSPRNGLTIESSSETQNFNGLSKITEIMLYGVPTWTEQDLELQLHDQVLLVSSHYDSNLKTLRLSGISIPSHESFSIHSAQLLTPVSLIKPDQATLAGNTPSVSSTTIFLGSVFVVAGIFGLVRYNSNRYFASKKGYTSI